LRSGCQHAESGGEVLDESRSDALTLLVVSRQLGHSNQIVTAQHYAHLLADEQLDAFADAQA
jgi:integrase